MAIRIWCERISVSRLLVSRISIRVAVGCIGCMLVTVSESESVQARRVSVSELVSIVSHSKGMKNINYKTRISIGVGASKYA